MYLSNESDEHVYFDNLKVQLRHKHIIEENHYYAYGLKIAGISSKAFDAPKNPYQYQGDYSEFDDETGWNDFALRSYDPQTGRFINADPYDQFASPYVGMGNDPVNNTDPSGGWVFSAIPLIEHGAWAIGGAVAGMVISGASSGWDITAMKQGAGIGFGVGLGASFVNWGNVGGLLQGGSSVPWILYNGTKVIIYEGKEGSTKKSKVITESNGTSGSTNHQFADEQFDRNPIYPGPVPEGNYKIDLTLDPNRKVVFDPESGAANRDRGIQQIPHFTQRNDGNKQNNWDVWGTVRARLEKDPGNNDPRMRGENDGYYLHDSDKGNTHGCIECSKKKIFDQLLKYRAEGIKSIRVKVKYPKPKTFTNGGPHGK
ncbi:MAG: RHS repeat-associated core domain-containing protein [Sphingobacteriales bacterium]|nr:RHS repeat-associated core domain-containing protein [Sphingobacteriales bacterium]